MSVKIELAEIMKEDNKTYDWAEKVVRKCDLTSEEKKSHR